MNMSEDFNREDDLQFFAQPYSSEPEYIDDEIREMGVLRQNAGSWNRWIVNIFVSFVYKKYSRSFIKLWLNHWCYMDYFNNVLTTFLGLNVVVKLLFMQDQKAFRFHQKYLHLCSEDEDDLTGLGRSDGNCFSYGCL